MRMIEADCFRGVRTRLYFVEDSCYAIHIFKGQRKIREEVFAGSKDHARNRAAEIRKSFFKKSLPA